MSETQEQPKVEEEKKASETVQEPEELDEKEAKQDPTAENEIRVAAKGQIKNYLGYAFRILNKTNHKSLKIRATGNAIVKANILIELVKRRVGDLHQLNSIYSMVIKSTESKNPLNEVTEMKRRVTAMDTLLSKEPLDETDPGYQKPEPKEEPYHGSRQPRKKDKEDGGDKKERRGKKGPKTFNQLPGEENKEAKKEDQGKKKDDKKKEPKKDGKGQDEKKGRRSRKEKITAGVKDDEMDKKAQGKRQGGRRERGGRHMMHPGDMYGPRMGMPMGPDGPRGYPMYHMGKYAEDPRRPRDPRAMPPYMGYPVRSYDDFNVRPNRGGKNNRRGHMNDPRQGMYYPPYYDPYMMYPEYGRRNYNPGPREQRQYNPDPEGERNERRPDNFNNRDRGSRGHERGGPSDPRMYNERPGRMPEDQRAPERGMRGDHRGRDPAFRGRGMPRDTEQEDDQKEFKPRGEYRPQRGDFNGERGRGGGPRGNYPRELRPYVPREDQKPDGLNRERFGDAIRGNRGMRGSRGSGIQRGSRGGEYRGSDRGGDPDERGRGRRTGEPFIPSNHHRNERGDGDKQVHRVHQKPSRGGRGEGAEQD